MKFPFCCSCCLKSADADAESEAQAAIGKSGNATKPGGQNHQNFRVFSYSELTAATQGFSSSNKIGEGSFGSVYKGRLGDGNIVAVKVLSVELESMRGEREFTSELAALSTIKHENLVTLQGCCIDGTRRFLVYDYMKNNSLARILLGEKSRVKLNWETRRRISLGIARGLAYLHEEITPHIVHRDIKASNILIDQNFTPKVSDFGLSKLLRDNRSHISTRVAGTLGYLAPEYAVSGHLTRKSDVYGFGVLLLEIISGRPVVCFDVERGEQYLVQKAWEAYEAEDMVRLVDPTLTKSYSEEEIVLFLKVGLLCVQENVRLRPSMSTANKMLNNDILNMKDIQISKPGIVSDFMDIKLGSTIIS